MATVRDLITGSLRLLGAVASGESLPADEERDALSALILMVQSWSTERLFIYSDSREEFSLTPGQQTYTMGVGGNFNTSRPVSIEKAAIEVQGANPIEIPIDVVNLDEWASIAGKSVQSSIPRMLYPENTYPLLSLTLWPIPSVAEKLVVYSLKPISDFASADATISFPPGYERALKYNLAIELAPEFGKEPAATVVAIAIESKESIKRQNIAPHYMESDALGLSSRRKAFDYRTGE